MLERLYDQIVDDWRALQVGRRTLLETQDRLRARVAQARALGASGRGISRRTQVPEANVRRWGRTQSQTPGRG